MVSEKTQYVEKSDTSNIKGGASYRAGVGMVIGGAVSAVVGGCIWVDAEKSRHVKYVEFEGETHEIYGAVPPEKELQYNVGMGMLIAGPSLAMMGIGIATD